MKYFFDFLTAVIGGILGLIYACFGLILISILVAGMIIFGILLFPFIVYLFFKEP